MAQSISESHSSKSDIATIEPNIKLLMFAEPFLINAESTAVSPIPADITITVAISWYVPNALRSFSTLNTATTENTE